jgi:hypothetical protein
VKDELALRTIGDKDSQQLLKELRIHDIDINGASLRSVGATLPNISNFGPYGDTDSASLRLPSEASMSEITDWSIYRGASMLSCDATCLPNWIHKSEYDEVGPQVVSRKCLI